MRFGIIFVGLSIITDVTRQLFIIYPVLSHAPTDSIWDGSRTRKYSTMGSVPP